MATLQLPEPALDSTPPSEPVPGALSPRLLPPDHVVVDVAAATPQALYAAIGAVVARRGGPTVRQVVQRLSGRHARQTPALGDGLALPHAAVPALARPCAVFVRLEQPLSLGAPDGRPVRDCLALLAPMPGFAADLELLEQARRWITSRAVVEGLRASDGVAQIQALLYGLPLA